MDSEHPLDIITNATGIGPSTLSDFEDAGFTTADEIGTHSPEELANTVNGVGYSTAISLLKYLEEQGLRDTTQRDKDLEKLISLLEELFEFNKQDRDFGVYRLMNQNREEIETYIREDLVNTIETEVSEIQEQFKPENADEVRQKVITELESDAWTSDNSLTDEARKKIQDRTEGHSEKELENIRSEIYNHIYTFFNQYYENGDFITRRKRSHHEEPYSVPYDGSNTHFHWVTKNQYYAKTSEQFTKFRVNITNHTFQFNTVHLEDNIPESEQIGNNTYLVLDEKSIFTSDSETSISFTQRPVTQEDIERIKDLTKGTRDKQKVLNKSFSEEISERVEPEVRVDSKELLGKLNEYTTRNQNDFFIHKDINTFLKTELEEYVKSEIVSYNPSSGTEGLSDIDMEKGRVVNEIAIDIIEFVSHIEEFKRKLFEKKKFVTERTELHQLTEIPEEYYEDVLNNQSQLEDWEDSYGIDVESLTAEMLEEQPYNQMVVDTSYFESDITTGEEPQNKLIKGDNYQALNFLQEKYEENVKCIYIDPPYNTGNANFAYKDKYQRPTWLSMMYDRLEKAKRLLKNDGIIFSSIDYNEHHRLKLLFDEIYGEENFVASFVWKRRAGGGQDSRNNVAIDHEYVLAYSKSDNFKARGIKKNFDRYTNPDNDLRGPWVAGDLKSGDTREEAPTLYYDIDDPDTGITYEADPDSVWRLAEDTMEEYIEQGRIIFPDDPDGVPKLKRFKNELRSQRKPISSWIETSSVSNTEIDNREKLLEQKILTTGLTGSGTRKLQNVFGYKPYDYPKPQELIYDLIDQSTSDGDVILDFFAGSGTTAQAVQELNRERDEQVNYILVEMLDEAFEITEERVKRTAFSKEWKDGKPQLEESDTPLDLSVEEIHLESYEDALDTVSFENNNQTNLGSFNPSTLQYTLDFGTKGSPVFVDTSQFSKPLEYSLEGAVSYTPTDLLTTFNYLIGLQGYERRTRTISGVEYTMFEGEINDSSVLVVWRHDVESVDYNKEQDAIQLEDFDTVYVNGDSQLAGAVPVEKVFTQKMLNKGGTL